MKAVAYELHSFLSKYGLDPANYEIQIKGKPLTDYMTLDYAIKSEIACRGTLQTKALDKEIYLG